MDAIAAPNRPGRLERIEPVPPRPGADLAAFLHFKDDLGRPCAVYAAIALPAGPGPHPGLVHAPGGTQTVDEADLRFWAGHGFVCAALDWQHGWWPHHPPGRKSCWPAGVVEQANPARDPQQAILPIAVRAVGVVLDWLGARPEVDPARLGMTGISWGGYLTWVCGALEPRLRAIAPTYGCGGLFEPGHASRPPVQGELERRWATAWDPLALAPRQRLPVCHLSGGNDFFGRIGHADRLLAALAVPQRRCWGPNLDHALDPGAGALAVAWMRHHLAGGPALPAAPAWDADGRVVTDPAHPPLAVEPWWTPSDGDDDRRCWWPGEPPAGAPVRARLAVVRWADGTSQSTPLWRPAGLPPVVGDLGDAWGDARAGLGWHWGWSTTQLHGGEGVGCQPLADPAWVRLEARPVPEPGSLLLFMTADPRWNRPGIDGLELRLRHSALPAAVSVTAATSGPVGRHLATVSVPVDADGTVRVRRNDFDALPSGCSWQAVTRLELAGLPRTGLELGAIRRLHADCRAARPA